VAGARLLDLSGGIRLWDWLANGSVPRIVYYHNVHRPEDDVSWCREPSLTMPFQMFRAHLESLRRRFDLVDLEDVAAAPGRGRLALTFDDGYRGVYDNAFPLLREWGIPATIFLVTDRIGSSEPLWWDKLLRAVEWLRGGIISGEGLQTLLPAWRRLLLEAPLEQLLDAYKQSGTADREAVDSFLHWLTPPKVASTDRIFLDGAEIRELQRAGFTFGAHTRTHPLLTWLDDQRLQDELVGSRDAVLSLTGKRECWFSYPDGTFGSREENAVTEAGFSGAVQTGRRPDRISQYALPRVGMSPWVVAGPNGEYSAWRERWALSRFTSSRMYRLLSRRV
jgi:peptidoglycan/xylan/chitin deacetylase (PgdA/CDA1 family)